MLSKVQPCFQLLRIGSSSSSAASDTAQDLYTFRPALPRSVFRLGRKPDLCDVTLNSAVIDRVHAELLAEREDGLGEEGWRVHLKDRSTYGTWVNELRLQAGVQCELSDGDTLTFGGQSDSGNPEFYFLFQKVMLPPSEFDAITLPKASSFTSDLQDRIRTSLDTKPEPKLELSSMSIKRATVILNSIGSISKMNGSCWTFKRTDDDLHSKSESLTPPFLVSPSTPPSLPPAVVSTSRSVPPSSKSRRKSAHTVLLEDDSSDEMTNVGGMGDGRRKNAGKRRRLCKSECEVFHPSVEQEERYGQRLEFRSESKNPDEHNFSLQPKGKLTHLFAVSGQRRGLSLNLRMDPDDGISTYSLRKESFPSSPSSRGRRRANSSPAYSPPVIRGQNSSPVSQPSRLSEADARSTELAGVPVSTGKRRGRPRKHPIPPQPPTRSPFHPLSGALEGERVRVEEPCASASCRLPQQDTVQWIQCDDCDAWYHIDCVQVDMGAFALDTSADFHCGCR
ncbi:transcription factor 19 [Arapaima gigas]